MCFFNFIGKSLYWGCVLIRFRVYVDFARKFENDIGLKVFWISCRMIVFIFSRIVRGFCFRIIVVLFYGFFVKFCWLKSVFFT